MFFLVEFTSSKTVNVIPASWYNDGICWWPNYTNDSRIHRAIQNAEEPGVDWATYDVRILTKSEDYLTARQKLKASLHCDTSDLQSDNEDVTVLPKRKLKPVHRLGDSDDSDMDVRREKRKKEASPPPPVPCPTLFPLAPPLLSHVSNPPKIPQAWSDTDANLLNLPQPGSGLVSVSGPQVQHPNRFTHDEQIPTSESLWPISDPGTSFNLPTPPGPSLGNTIPHQNLPSFGNENYIFKPTLRIGRYGTDPIPCSAAQLHMLTLMENLKQQQNQLLSMFNLLSGKMLSSEVQAEMPDSFQFPLYSLEEVEELEAWLIDPSNSGLKQNMISALASIGGSDVKRVTWNILAHMFSDRAAKKINWKGVNGKKAFKQMLCKGILIQAVQRCHASQKASNDDICRHAIRWFNLAADREGGRKKRASS